MVNIVASLSMILHFTTEFKTNIHCCYLVKIKENNDKYCCNILPRNSVKI